MAIIKRVGYALDYIVQYIKHRYCRFTMSAVWLWFLGSFIVPNPVTLYPCKTPLSPENSMIKGIIRICVNNCDTEMLCLSLVSVRSVARWVGPQIIVTDKGEHIRSSCNISGLEFIAAPKPKFEWDDRDNRRSNSRYRLQIKEDMWSLVKHKAEDNAGYLIYADSDLVFTSCLEPERLLSSANHKLSLFPDNWCYDCNEYNMGVSLSNKEARYCFHDISEHIAKHDTPREQVALDRLLEGKTHNCGSLYKMDKDYIVFVSNDLITPRLQLLKTYLSGKGSPMFAHYGHATRNRFYWKRIFLNLQYQLTSFDTQSIWRHGSDLEEAYGLELFQCVILLVSGSLLVYFNSNFPLFGFIQKIQSRIKKSR